jgi:KaiC/GvpD/RAD55 family RecA-like ATPase
MSIKNTNLAQAKRARDIANVVGGTPEIDYDHPSLNRRFAMSVFRDTKATEIGRGPDATLIRLEAWIHDKCKPSKGELPLLKLATFGDAASDKGSLRHDANMIRITGVEVDYDAGQITPEQARDSLADAGLAGLVYTTPSHTTDAPRWRIICQTSKPMLPKHRDKLVARVNGLFNGKLAGESFTASQSFYFGGITGQPEPITYLNPGRYIDRAVDLDTGAIGRGGRDVKVAKGDDRDTGDTRTGRSPKIIADALWSIPNDGTGPCNERDDWLRVVQALHHEFEGSDDGLALLMEWSAQHPSHDVKKVRSAYRSCGRYRGKPVTAWGVLTLAEKEGWRDDDALKAMFDIDDDLPIEDKPQPKDFKLQILTPAQCGTGEPVAYVIKGLLSAGDVGAVIGAPGVGKSLFAPRLAYAVAQGAEVFGRRTRQGNVLYVAAEDERGMENRVKVLAMDHGDADEFGLVKGVSNLLPGSPDLKELLRVVRERKPSLVVIDTLAMAFPGIDENTAQAMGLVVSAARSLTKWGAAVLLVHHDTKAGDGLPRGHSLLNGALDVSISLTRDANGFVVAKPSKNRNGTAEVQLAFRIGTRSLGIDEDGDPRTTAIAEDLASDYEPVTKDVLSDSVRSLKSLFDELATESHGVDESEFRQASIDGRAVSASDNLNSRRDAFRRGLKQLIEKGLIIFDGGKYVHATSISKEDFDDDATPGNGRHADII